MCLLAALGGRLRPPYSRPTEQCSARVSNVCLIVSGLQARSFNQLDALGSMGPKVRAHTHTYAVHIHIDHTHRTHGRYWWYISWPA
jgi:hypothetical protein